MVSVGMRELRSSLSRYIARVREGETLVVTFRGEEVARIVPAKPLSKEWPAWYREMVAEGKIIPAQNPRGTFWPTPIKMLPGDKTAVDYVLEQRR
ncbi:MAG: type II toxin-antitoxin system prevent-host-death family antitoxin [Dehalococcoidia bacterium]